MTTEVAVITKSDLNVNFTYESIEPQQATFASPWNNESLYAHVSIPANLTVQNIKVLRVDGNIVIEEDPVRTEMITEGLWQNVRMRRNLLLSATDWTQLPDTQLNPVKKQQFIDYRQQLRDLPQSSINPTTINWPLEP